MEVVEVKTSGGEVVPFSNGYITNLGPVSPSVTYLNKCINLARININTIGFAAKETKFSGKKAVIYKVSTVMFTDDAYYPCIFHVKNRTLKIFPASQFNAAYGKMKLTSFESRNLQNIHALWGTILAKNPQVYPNMVFNPLKGEGDSAILNFSPKKGVCLEATKEGMDELKERFPKWHPKTVENENGKIALIEHKFEDLNEPFWCTVEVKVDYAPNCIEGREDNQRLYIQGLTISKVCEDMADSEPEDMSESEDEKEPMTQDLNFIRPKAVASPSDAEEPRKKRKK